MSRRGDTVPSGPHGPNAIAAGGVRQGADPIVHQHLHAAESGAGFLLARDARDRTLGLAVEWRRRGESRECYRDAETEASHHWPPKR